MFAPNECKKYQDALFFTMKQFCKSQTQFLDNISNHNQEKFKKISKELFLNSKLTCMLPLAIIYLIIDFSEL